MSDRVVVASMLREFLAQGFPGFRIRGEPVLSLVERIDKMTVFVTVQFEMEPADK